MVRSMTGFARSEAECEFVACSVELKSVNAKHLNLEVNVTGGFTEIEVKASRYLREKLRRGTVRAYVEIYFNESIGNIIRPDLGVASAYYNALNELADKFRIPDRISLDTLSKMKDVLKYRLTPSVNEKIWECLKIALDKAIAILDEDREREGKNLEKALVSYLQRLENIAKELHERTEGLLEYYREFLKKRISDVLEIEVDKSRLEQEVAILAERADISEEIVRLESHITSFKRLMESEKECGVQLDFLCQEMHREFSTIAAKSKKAEITSLSIEGRTLVNKIREQVQNIE
ncbi:MAG: YicC family protein [Kosmotoga sp.]|uniref:YicC/YloC family endoribonuclease n=1 Tax=Kosmotoga sp. TaxID=1955248 RepID=UPI0025BA1BE4|nr:YicC/YloC family endoribonuclease [Kosmotoga sp.]MCD6160211.1 YicC family protein [Kosmotoga sp.]